MVPGTKRTECGLVISKIPRIGDEKNVELVLTDTVLAFGRDRKEASKCTVVRRMSEG